MLQWYFWEPFVWCRFYLTSAEKIVTGLSSKLVYLLLNYYINVQHPQFIFTVDWYLLETNRDKCWATLGLFRAGRVPPQDRPVCGVGLVLAFSFRLDMLWLQEARCINDVQLNAPNNYYFCLLCKNKGSFILYSDRRLDTESCLYSVFFFFFFLSPYFGRFS